MSSDLSALPLPHPVAEVQGIAAPNLQGVRLLHRRNPGFFVDAGKRGELQHTQGLPTQLAEGGSGFSADLLPCHTSTAGEGVDAGGNEEGVGFGDRFAQHIDQRVVDALVFDARGSENKIHAFYF